MVYSYGLIVMALPGAWYIFMALPGAYYIIMTEIVMALPGLCVAMELEGGG